jgi:hypothetical protein
VDDVDVDVAEDSTMRIHQKRMMAFVDADDDYDKNDLD